MSLQTLDGDSLAQIVSYLECWDALQLSLVARSVHIIAKHHGLKYVSIHTYAGHIKFCRSMLSEMRHRLPYIHALETSFSISNEAEIEESSWLGPPTITVDHYKAAGTLFAQVLENASSLKRLTLNRAEVWMEYEPRIIEAIIDLRNLGELVLRDVGPRVSRVIHSMKSTPYKLGIPEAPGASYYVHHSFPLADNLRIPSVRHLILYGNMSVPPIDHLARVFPNVETLNLGNGWVNVPTEVGMEISWPHLAHIEGLPEMLAKWRNVSPVHSVCIPSDFGQRRDNPRLLDGIRNAQPVALSIVLFRPSADIWRGVMTSSPRLRYLSIEAYDLRWSHCWQQDLGTWFVSTVH